MQTLLGPMPAVAFGTWPLRGSDCRKLVGEALAVGYRHIDTAQAYGNEAEVGQGIRDSKLSRETVFVTTKIWPDRLRENAVVEAAAESLARLKFDYLDLLLIHWPNPQVPVAETLAAFERLRREGKVRQIGVSNFNRALLAEAKATGLALFCDQVEFHVFLAQERLYAAIREAGLNLMAYSPLARGRVLDSPVLTRMGKRHNRTASQVALRWILQHEGAGYAAKASSRARIEENFDVFSFALSAAEMTEIGTMADGRRAVNASLSPGWD